MPRHAMQSFLGGIVWLATAAALLGQPSLPLCQQEESGSASVAQALQDLKQAGSEAADCSASNRAACTRARSLLGQAQTALERVINSATRRQCWSCSTGVLQGDGGADLFLPESLGQAANSLAAVDNLIRSRTATRRASVGRVSSFTDRVARALTLPPCSRAAPPPPTRASYQGGGPPVGRQNGGSSNDGSGAIAIRQATYGSNCGARAGFGQSHIQRQCNGRSDCGYLISTQELGDPAPGCNKNYDVSWDCGSETFQLKVDREAGKGDRAVFLNCRGGQVMRVGRGITVLEASYGLNCQSSTTPVSAGNASQNIGLRCNRRLDCSYEIDAARLGNPAPSCARAFRVKWMCEDGTVRQTSVAGEASGRSVRLTCSR